VILLLNRSEEMGMGGLPIPELKIPFKVVLFVYYILVVFANMVEWLPRSYTICVAWTMAIFLWNVVNKQDPDAALMLMNSLLLGIVFDVIHCFAYYSCSYDRLVVNGSTSSGEFKFAVGMTILNLLLKPVYLLIAYQQFTKRGGDISQIAQGKVGGLVGGFTAPGGHGYQNMEDQSAMLDPMAKPAAAAPQQPAAAAGYNPAQSGGYNQGGYNQGGYTPY
jgi:hypothetical protein